MRMLVHVAVLVLTSLVLKVADAYTVYYSRILRNPGLTTTNATCLDACADLCKSSIGCSAMSYRQATRTCLLSMCNSLDLYSAMNWITYIFGKFTYRL